MGLKLNGATSGSIEIDVPAVAGTDTSITIPATSGGEFIVSDSAGDVNIDSGTLFVDSSANSVGLGTTSPQSELHINKSDSTGAHVQFTNSTTGATTSDGFEVGIGNEEQAQLWQYENTYMRFATNNTEQMRIADDGTFYAGINRGTLDSSNYGTRIGASSAGAFNAGWITTYRAANAANPVLEAGGTVGYARIMGDGDLENTNNRYTGLSDIKLKQNIQDASSQWNDIKSIQVRSYELIAQPDRRHIGVVAQEIEQICPGLVIERIQDEETGETVKSVAYSVLYMKAVKALQEAMERIETLETANASLEARLTALEGGAS